MRRIGLVLVIALAALGVVTPGAAAENPSQFAIASLSASLSTSQAGAHPDFNLSFEFSREANGSPYARTSGLEVRIPPGLLANPSNAPKCTAAQLSTTVPSNPTNETGCPQDSQVGISEVQLYGAAGPLTIVEPVYDMVAAGPHTVARFGIFALNYPVFLTAEAKPEDNYAVTTKIEGISSYEPLLAANTTLWGVPAATSHDAQRITPFEAISNGGSPETPTGERSSGLTPTAFMVNPTRCGVPLEVAVKATTYAEPSRPVEARTSLGEISGCGKLAFKPSFTLRPTTTAAESPAGVDAEITLPQAGLVQPNLLATPHLKKAVAALPQGVSLNPSAASGLGACTEGQVGVVSESPILFNDAPAACPASAQVGTAEIITPILPEPVQARLYVASQNANPFHTLLAGYLVAEGQGLTLKVAGQFDLNPVTGQITAIFADNPQAPFEDLKLHFKEGNHGVLITPASCGNYATSTSLSSWAAQDPENPSAADTVFGQAPFVIDRGPGGSACAAGQPNNPRFEAGTKTPLAGFYSPFVLDLSREDGTQRIGAVNLSLPPGLTGKLAGIPYCTESAIASAGSKSGREELASPSCPAASEVGTVTVGAGAGPQPLYVEGKAYLAGPYKGAPLSLAIITPAVAGPFDLGTVVVRSALYVNEETAQISVKSDPLPTILQGVPLDVRDIRVEMNRSNFTLNPTSCEAMLVSGEAISTSGQPAQLSNRFQVGGCKGLDFKPKVNITLSGSTRRAGHPGLKAVVTFPNTSEEANIARAQVNLPHSEFLDQGNLNKTCTRPVLRAGNCPKSTIYGKAKAWTPLLEKPLEGNVYLVGGYGYKLPALVAELNGQIRFLLAGKVDTGPNNGIRNTFELVPDAPVSRFVLQMKGGRKYSLLENSENLCAKPQRAIARFTAQSGRVLNLKPIIANDCNKKKGGKKASPKNGN
jgi:hypothetical protein